ncbi:MAG: DNA polymerase IV [Chloroflexi bacterium]|nr:DNA polymerase IV [Chloroflexota bacterium]
MPRKILHLDLDAFFCAVEELHNPALTGKPFAVGGNPEGRGVVASCSYAARVFGIHSAMPMAEAVRRCPELIIVPNRRGAYTEMSRRVMAILHELTPWVEQISIDEAFLDVSDLPQEGKTLAGQLQTTIRSELDLPCSLGVATNKLVAKIANDVGKGKIQSGAYPNAITLVPAGKEVEFLAPLPTRSLWGVGPKTAERLAALGIRHIGDIAIWPEDDLVRRFGKHGRDLAQRAQGIDDRAVATEREAKSISKELTFAKDVADGTELRRTIRRLAEGVGRGLRRQKLSGVTVRLKLRWPDFTTLTRQTTLASATDRDSEIVRAALRLFDNEWSEGRHVRLIGVGVSGLQDGYRQLSLWDAEGEHDRELQHALDDIRQKYGRSAVRRGTELDDRRYDDSI